MCDGRGRWIACINPSGLQFTHLCKRDISCPSSAGRLQFTKTTEEACVATELTKDKIEEKVFGIVAEQLQVPKKDITANSSVINGSR